MRTRRAQGRRIWELRGKGEGNVRRIPIGPVEFPVVTVSVRPVSEGQAAAQVHSSGPRHRQMVMETVGADAHVRG